MNITVSSQNNSIQFQSDKTSKLEIVDLRINIGLDLVEVISEDLFLISHIDYLNNFDYINDIIKKLHFNIDISFKNFVTNIFLNNIAFLKGKY